MEFYCRQCKKPRELEIKRYSVKDKRFSVTTYQCGSKLTVEATNMQILEHFEKGGRCEAKKAT